MANAALESDYTAIQAANSALHNQVDSLQTQLAEVKTQLAAALHQLDWFKRQLFGQKSEKLRVLDPAIQASLLAGLVPPVPPSRPVAARPRTVTPRKKLHDGCVNDTGLRFDASVPVRVIEVPTPTGWQGEVIATHSTFRLAQRRAAYEILEYRCPVLRQAGTGTLQTTPIPAAIFAGSVADVSFLAGMLVDKFASHLPLYRQHQRLAQAGITLSRGTLTQLVMRTASLLAPIHQAQLDHVLQSHVLAMDETPIKAGQREPGKLHAAYFWPLYGDADEVSFTFADTRAKTHIDTVLGDRFHGVLLTDGYDPYARYAEARPAVTHAQCWSHTRRYFERAQASDPHVQEGMALIAELYHQEADIRNERLAGTAKQQARTRREAPLVRAFWAWCDRQCQRPDLEPSHPLAKALAYAQARKAALEVCLDNPDVPLDTNHLERALRPIPMGRKAWLFCWTEVGAEAVAIVQSLITTCRVQGVDPYTYLVDVLQRVQTHPAKRVVELTPRLWKQHFADRPLRSDVERLTPQAAAPPPATQPPATPPPSG
ncbi:MAG: IS66 family transposase [Terriglobales bacterium]